jgi:hypothetical protein
VEENWCIETIVSGKEESKDGIPSELQVPEAVTARRQNIFMMLHSLLSVIVVACMAWERYSRASDAGERRSFVIFDRPSIILRKSYV